MKFSVAVVAVASVLASAQAGYWEGYNTRTCTATGARCAGAPGKPYVKYAPCCEDGKVCAPKDSPGYGEWGRYCMERSTTAPDMCYKTGERCMGAPGMPYVAYHKCCGSGESCVEDASKGWGGFCMAPSEPAMGDKMCYATGERCMGAAGMPYVKYMKCCGYGETCVTDPAMGWGGFCKAGAPVVTDSPVVTEPAVTDAPYVPKNYYGGMNPGGPGLPIPSDSP